MEPQREAGQEGAGAGEAEGTAAKKSKVETGASSSLGPHAHRHAAEREEGPSKAGGATNRFGLSAEFTFRPRVNNYQKVRRYL